MVGPDVAGLVLVGMHGSPLMTSVRPTTARRFGAALQGSAGRTGEQKSDARSGGELLQDPFPLGADIELRVLFGRQTRGVLGAHARLKGEEGRDLLQALLH